MLKDSFRFIRCIGTSFVICFIFMKKTRNLDLFSNQKSYSLFPFALEIYIVLDIFNCLTNYLVMNLKWKKIIPSSLFFIDFFILLLSKLFAHNSAGRGIKALSVQTLRYSKMAEESLRILEELQKLLISPHSKNIDWEARVTSVCISPAS